VQSFGATDLKFFTNSMVRPFKRVPQSKGDFVLPEGTRVISADNHFSIAEDIWFERFPSSLKDKAPRVWRGQGGTLHVGFNGISAMPEAMHAAIAEFDQLPGCSSVEDRLRDLDAEGIEKEIVFPNGALGVIFRPEADLNLREYTFRIYNEYMAELQQRMPGRFYGVGFINWWDPSKTRDSMRELKGLGLKAFMLPQNPGLDHLGRKIEYQSRAMEPMWQAIEESELPVSFHIGESAISSERGEPGISALQNFAPFRKTVGELVFGGILDRHPSLQVVFAEGGINWGASLLQDMAFIYAGHRNVGVWQAREDVEYYWHNNLYTTFMFDKLGLAMLNLLGPDRVMWAQDYPHGESAFGYSWSAMKQVVDATTAQNARKILGGTAERLWKL
jgi:predicted TIM-barrel fold metal-dependent hydrolase